MTNINLRFCLLLLTLVNDDFVNAASSKFNGQSSRSNPDDDPKNIPVWIKAGRWPQNYSFDTPLIDNLTGYEEPLKYLKVMPYRLEDIGTQFPLFASWRPSKQKYLFHLNYNNMSSLEAFPSRCSKLFLFIHGYNGNLNQNNSSDLNPIITSILDNEDNACLIGVDWSRGAAASSLHATVMNIDHLTLGIINQAANTVVVGRQTAFLLYLLVSQERIRAKDIHVIGHSMGGQLTHFVGSYYTQLVKKHEADESTEKKVNFKHLPLKLGRITGLDIEGTPFHQYPGCHLNREDASFVDLIHTTSGLFDGRNDTLKKALEPITSIPWGHVDFYPNNGGPYQPDCQPQTVLLGSFAKVVSCSHTIVWDFMAQSFDKTIPRDKFRSVHCAFDKLDQCMKKTTTSFGSMGRDAERARGRGIQFLVYRTKPSSQVTY